MNKIRSYAGLINTLPLSGNTNASSWISSFGFADHAVREALLKDTQKRLAHDRLMNAIFTGKAFFAYLKDFTKKIYDISGYIYMKTPISLLKIST